VSGTPYLLDTNILIHYVRGSRVWQRIERRFSLLLRDPRPLYSVVTIGELRSLASRRGWQARRLSQLNFALAYFRPFTLDHTDVYRAYAAIDTFTQGIGRPMGDNDVWIAATARAFGATILTTEHDFDHLVPALVQVEWFDPTIPTGGTP